MYRYHDGSAMRIGDIVSLNHVARATVVAILDAEPIASRGYERLIDLVSGVVVEEEEPGGVLYHLLEPKLHVTLVRRGL